jgi:hypothetical protein
MAIKRRSKILLCLAILDVILELVASILIIRSYRRDE